MLNLISYVLMISTVVLGWRSSEYFWIFIMGLSFATTYVLIRLPQFTALKSRDGVRGVCKLSGMVLIMQMILATILFFVGMGLAKIFSLF